jgi:hypothetical protein
MAKRKAINKAQEGWEEQSFGGSLAIVSCNFLKVLIVLYFYSIAKYIKLSLSKTNVGKVWENRIKCVNDYLQKI